MNQKRNQKPGRKVNQKYDPYIKFLAQVIKTYTATTPHYIYKDNNLLAEKNVVFRNLATHEDYIAIHFEWVIYTKYFQNKSGAAKEQVGVEIHVERFKDANQIKESQNIFNHLLAASSTFPGGFQSGPNVPPARLGCHHIYVLKDYVSPIAPHTINWAVTKMIEFQNYFIPILGNLYNQGVIKSGSPNFAKWP